MPTDSKKPAGVLVIGEMEDGAPSSLVLELLGLARRLLDGNGPASVLVLGQSGVTLTSALIAAGADRVYVAPGDARDVYASDVWLAALHGVLASVTPDLVLVGHTSLGAELAPRLAFRLGAAVATGCEALAWEDGHLMATRPCFGHKAREVIGLRTQPAIATVRARASDPLRLDASRVGDVVTISMDPPDTASTPCVTARARENRSDGIPLEKAKVVVAGGRGLGGPEGFSELARLAERIGGVVGASRVACDLGWCPRSWQIGLTGKTVTPSLYIAVGISGASHHMAGCGNSGAILAINSDPEAAIFKEARFGIVGDYKQILPVLVDQLARFKSQQPVTGGDAAVASR